MSYSPKREQDHEGSGLSKLLEHYQRADRLRALIAPWLRQIQRLEDAAWEVLAKRFDHTGEGVLLDWLGKIIGARPRAGLSDAGYLLVLQAQIVANRASGRPGDIQAVLRLTLPPGFAYSYREEYPAAFSLDLRHDIIQILPIVRATLRQIKPAGVRLFAAYLPEGVDNENDLRFSDAASPDDPDVFSPHGFGDSGGLPGGRFVSCFAL